MNQHDGAIRTYADGGLGAVEDWNYLATPRGVVPHRATILPLFTRHQTRAQARSWGVTKAVKAGR